MKHEDLPNVPCEACGKPMLWVTTVTGKKMPLSVDSAERRYFIARTAGDAPIGLSEMTYLSHFADCPDADSFRRPR